MNASPLPFGIRLAAAVALLFGLLTLKEGGLVLFGPAHYAEEAGNVVPFVLWFNFIAGFFYIVAAVLLWRGLRAGALLAVAIAAGTATVFLGLGVHIFVLEGAYEQRTVVAMTVRLLVWSAIAVYAWKQIIDTGRDRGDGTRCPDQRD